jgi:hypothetical protein
VSRTPWATKRQPAGRRRLVWLMPPVHCAGLEGCTAPATATVPDPVRVVVPLCDWCRIVLAGGAW